MPVVLTVLEGPNSGQAYTFDAHDTFVVGRAPEAHFRLPDDPYFSRLQFLIEVNPPLCRITDLGSRNGTSVNDRPVQSSPLKNGDRVRGGQTVLLVTISEAGGRLDATRDLPAPPAPPPAGTLVDAIVKPPESALSIPGYHVERELGRGAMGIVYRATRAADGCTVALKVIRPAVAPTESMSARFLREASILKDLDHPGIVRFVDMGVAEELLYFAMEFVAGRDADSWVKDAGPLPVPTAVGVVSQLLAALDHAHRRGFVHRDVKPANVLVEDVSGRPAVKLADFGLARAYESSPMSGLTVAGHSGGTPYFMPPEQITDFRNVKPAADQYSAAATLYWLLTGRAPHMAERPADLFKKILLEEPAPVRSLRPEVPAPLEKAIHTALRRKPEQRFGDAIAFQTALNRAV